MNAVDTAREVAPFLGVGVVFSSLLDKLHRVTLYELRGGKTHEDPIRSLKRQWLQASPERRKALENRAREALDKQERAIEEEGKRVGL
jgi:hypothetical protein